MNASFVIARAALALLLMIGFYLLALSIAFALLWVPYAEFVYAEHITPKLAIICILGGLTILWSVLPRWDTFRAPGPLLTREKHPRLFKALELVAGATRQTMPAEVYLVPDVNAWVMQRGGVMGLGGRRVMGLGLPLMRILSCSQFSAVLAHEFGHYHGGDTKIGPWIYKTRGAIGRTLNALGTRSWLQAPFRCYARMFLRVTHAVSRRQEFIADELAARTLGAKPLADGLCSVHRVAPAFDYYWRNECAPVLSAGFLPPLADGFDRFVRARHISASMDEQLEVQLSGGNSDPYDTHPPLRDRIAAIAHLPHGPAQGQELPAASLLDDVPALEKELLAKLAGTDEAGRLKQIVWDEVGACVYIPLWARLVGLNANRLKSVTPDSLGSVATNLRVFGKTLVDPANEPPDDDNAEALANAVVGAAMALLLIQRGGQVDIEPGHEVSVNFGAYSLKPFGLLPTLKNDRATSDTWIAQCAEVGIAGIELATAAPSSKDSAKGEPAQRQEG
jgi:heat shock protein HtpX